MAGELWAHQFVKWQKNNSDAWIMLIGTDGLTLPPARDVALAHLVVSVSEAHDKADMLTAAVALKAPFETGKPYQFQEPRRHRRRDDHQEKALEKTPRSIRPCVTRST